MILPTDRTVFQNAWVVPDLKAGIKHWTEIMKVGPFFILDHSEDMVDIRHRGEPGTMSMTLALAQAGPVQIELIEVHGDGPNCYRDIYKPGQSGFHHMCVWTHDIDADNEYFESNGFPIATQGRVDGSIRFAYYDTFDALGGMIEVMEKTPEVEGLFEIIRAASVDWDGTDPIRQLG
jgi:hypothetical protein